MKDPFNGKIKIEHINSVIFSLIFAGCFFLIAGIFFLMFALFYKNVEYNARIFLYALSGSLFLVSIIYPLITLKLIKSYPKHKKSAHFFMKPYVFKSTDIENENR